MINVITKRGRDKPEISLEAGYGSYDEQRLKAFTSAKAGQFDIAAWGSHFAAGNPKDGMHRTLSNSGLDNRDQYGFNAGWNFTEKDRIGISFNGMTGQKQENSPAIENNYANQYQNRNYWLLDLVYEGATQDDSLSWLVRYYFGETDYELNRESRRTASLGQRALYSHNSNKIQGGQAQVTFAGVDRLKLTGGVDVLYYDLEQAQPSGIHTPLIPFPSRRDNYTSSDYLNIGAFLTGQLYLLEKKNLVLSAGARYDYFDINVDTKFVLGTSRARSIAGGAGVNNFVPSFGVSYSPWDFVKFRSSYGSAFRMPTPREVGGVFMMGTSLFVGNPGLVPEKSRTWDIGFDLEYEALNLSFTYFDTRYKDKITALPAGSVPKRPDDRPYVNLPRTSRKAAAACGRHRSGEASPIRRSPLYANVVKRSAPARTPSKQKPSTPPAARIAENSLSRLWRT